MVLQKSPKPAGRSLGVRVWIFAGQFFLGGSPRGSLRGLAPHSFAPQKAPQGEPSWYQDYSVLLTAVPPSFHLQPAAFVPENARNFGIYCSWQIFITLPTHFHMHIQRHTHTSTYVHQHTRGMATTRHRSLVERGGRKALLETLHTDKKKKPIKICQKKTGKKQTKLCQKKTGKNRNESQGKIRAHRPSRKANRLFLTK